MDPSIRTSSPLMEDLVALCRPPASSWATTSTGRAPLAESYLLRHFGTADVERVRIAHWETVRARLPVASTAVLGIPFDGASFGRRGAASGPTGVRAAWDPSGAVVDCGDVHVVPQLFDDALVAGHALADLRLARFGRADAPWPVSPVSVIAFLATHFAERRLPLVAIGGDHAVTVPLVQAFAGRSIGLVHLDGHDDLGLPRDGVSLAHSSWLFELVRTASCPPLVIQAGMPHDGRRGTWLGDRLVRLGALSDDEAVDAAVNRSVACLERAGITAVYVSIDLDVLDQGIAPGTNLPNAGGLSLGAVERFLAGVAERVAVVAGDVVEIAPVLAGTTDWTRDPSSLAAAALVDLLCASSGRPHP